MESRSNIWFSRKIKSITGRVACCDNELIQLYARENPSIWAEKNINFRNDVSLKVEKFDLSLTPYLKDVINSWEFDDKIVETTVVAPEQTGKSLSWIVGLLWSFIYKPCLSIIVYPSDDLAIKINKEKLEPLMRNIPKLKAELGLPRSQKKDCYHFSNLKSYFSGAGSRITSQSAKIRIADEIDDWASHEGKITNVHDLRKRARSFDESIFFKVCTPTTKTGGIWSEFLKSSQGYWYLRCLNCNKLTMRSSDIHNMQWELNKSEKVIEESIVLICPECKHEHKESDKRQMNLLGGYIHLFPDLIGHHNGYQWGALASQWQTLNWVAIAQSQMLAGKSGDIQDQMYFDNSIRGIPFIKRSVNTATVETLKTRIISEIDYSKIEGIFYTGDTQDDCIYYVIAAIDNKSNIYILENGKKKTLEEVRTIINSDYQGFPIIAGIQDEGGHRTLEIKKFVESIKKMYTYKGNNRQMKRIDKSSTDRRLLLAKEVVFRTGLLFYLHVQTNKDNNYLYFSNKVDEEFLEHLSSYRKDNTKKNGDDLENWTHDGRKHDYFDCLKMLYVLVEYLKQVLPSNSWYKGNCEWTRRVQQTHITNKRPPSYPGFVYSWKE